VVRAELVGRQADEEHEGQVVAQLRLHLPVGYVVQILADHDPQHHLRRHRRPAAVAVAVLDLLGQRGPVDQLAQAAKHVILRDLGLVDGVAKEVPLALLLTSHRYRTPTRSTHRYRTPTRSTC